MKNTLNGKKAKGKFVKKANCFKDGVGTTTTIPKLITTTSISPVTTTDLEIDITDGVTTTTTTIPTPTTTIFVDPNEEDPLTDEEGNDIYIWDFEEDLYFTDGDFTVTYLYQENNITMADTGGSLNYIYFSGVPLFFIGLVFLTRSRRRRLLYETPHLKKVYENACLLQNEIESLVNSKVKITIDIAEKYNPLQKNVAEYNSLIASLMKELEYTIDVVKNLKKKNIYKDVNENVIIESLKENLSSIGNEDFHFVFTEESLQNDNKLIEFKETKARKNKVKKKRKKIPGRVVAASFFLISFVFALIGFQQTIYTNSLQITAQERFQETFNNEAPIQELNERKTDINYELVSYEEPASIFPEIREIFNLRRKSTNISSQEASVFGLLEISEINLEQYVVIGTSELALQDGPGYYLGTELPGSGGNVGIAGHRTTYGAPFRDLDLVQIGDELNLTFGSNTYTYIVDEIHVVPARGGEYLLYNNGVDRLTLTTCHPRYSAKERLVVSGILKKIKTST